MRSCRILVLGLVATLAAANGWAFNPGTDSRAEDTAMQVSPIPARFCEGGAFDGQTCTDTANCDPPNGACTGIEGVQVAARGVLTIVTDTITPGTGWDDTDPSEACTDPAEAAISSCETSANATLTMMLEFTLNGTEYFFAETFKDLLDAKVEPAGYRGWDQEAVESVLAERTADSSRLVKIRWGILSPAAEAAVKAALSGAPGQRVALSRTDEVPICTDPTACNHGPRNTIFSDHADGADVLGTARRYKVDIGLVTPGP